MIIASRELIDEFIKKHPQAKSSLELWMYRAESLNWKTPADIKATVRSVDFLHGNRAIFNISGNKYRLYVKVLYIEGILYVMGVYTHAEYSKLNLNK